MKYSALCVDIYAISNSSHALKNLIDNLPQELSKMHNEIVPLVQLAVDCLVTQVEQGYKGGPVTKANHMLEKLKIVCAELVMTKQLLEALIPSPELLLPEPPTPNIFTHTPLEVLQLAKPPILWPSGEGFGIPEIEQLNTAYSDYYVQNYHESIIPGDMPKEFIESSSHQYLFSNLGDNDSVKIVFNVIDCLRGNTAHFLFKFYEANPTRVKIIDYIDYRELHIRSLPPTPPILWDFIITQEGLVALDQLLEFYRTPNRIVDTSYDTIGIYWYTNEKLLKYESIYDSYGGGTSISFGSIANYLNNLRFAHFETNQNSRVSYAEFQQWQEWDKSFHYWQEWDDTFRHLIDFAELPPCFPE